MNYPDFFQKAAGFAPYPYQKALAEGEDLPALLRIPTGAGKTEAAILAWLYRRAQNPDTTPRRLVYCLPMRTLVEQTVERVERWLKNLGMTGDVEVVTLMGGEPRSRWYLEPEKPAVIVGTQDMLLSRALNRGYGMGYNMWPIEYGLLNNDCLWVMDEVQLMANGLPTSTQLAGLREKLGAFGPAQSVWMSATVRPDWLHTIDHSPQSPLVCELGDGDLADTRLSRRHNACKMVTEAAIEGKKRAADIANLISSHHKPGALTLAIVNTVERAQDVYKALKAPRAKLLPDAEKVLVHSRFRAADRKAKNDLAAATPDASGPGMVIVATQAVEAGVDISARTLITELAPWPSMVQRFGRCNREGKDDQANILWVDVDDKNAAPYEADALGRAREVMKSLEGKSAGPADLEDLQDKIGNPDHLTVIRRRDVVGLFDTTPDLSGSYLDVSQYVRGGDEKDVSVFWRCVPDPKEGPGADAPKPRHDEIVSVSLGSKGIGDYLKGNERRAWRWDFLDSVWSPVRANEIYPGMTLMLDAKDGWYSPETGWTPSSKDAVEPVPDNDTESEDGQGSDPTNTRLKRWITLSRHSRNVEREAGAILDSLSASIPDTDVCEAVKLAALYHDAGKAHPAFQKMLRSGLEDAPTDDVQLAKGKGSGKYEDTRRHFRHELGSALVVLAHATEFNDDSRALAAYLAAAHHGKVRLAIRSLPGARAGNKDSNPDPDRLLGYPITEPETLPSVDLGDGVGAPETTLDLSIARMGITDDGQVSWLERSLALLDQYGPFRLAYLEAIVRAADMRASKQEQESAQ